MTNIGILASDTETEADVNANGAINRKTIYWRSPEANKLFGFDLYPHCDVVAGLEERIDLLKKVNASENGYQLVLPIGAEIGDNYVSNHNKFIIRQKSLFLLKAYQIALDEMKVGVRWVDHICHKAVVVLKDYGFKDTTNAEVGSKWNCVFRLNDKLPHPNPNVRMGEKHKPVLFEVFPNIEAQVQEFVMNHLGYFCVEMLREVLIKNMIPDLIK